MGLLKFGLAFIAVVVIIIIAQSQIEPKKNIIFFENDVKEVVDSISKMENFMQRFPKTEMVNYYIDNDGYLHLNSARIALIKGAIKNQKVRRDMVFEKFDQNEIDQFFQLMAYLMRNHISSCYEDKRIQKFLFPYRSRNVKGDSDLREIMIVDLPMDTLNSNFKRAYKILDKKENAVLIISARIN